MNLMRLFLRRGRIRSITIVILLSVIAGAGIAGVIAYRCSVNGGPCFWGPIGGPSEQIVLDHYTIQTAPGRQSPSVLTLWMKNAGPSTVSLSTLYIGDGTSTVSVPVSQSIARGATNSVTVDTSGFGFYFASGRTYSVSVITGSNGQFTFDVIGP